MARSTSALPWLGVLLSAACLATRLEARSPMAQSRAAAPQKHHCNGVHCCGDYCDDDNNPCDPASGCTCSYLTNTCQARDNWCTSDQQCQGLLEDTGARCVANACWGTGTNCHSAACKNGDGCASDQDCAAGWTCSTGNGVCQPPEPPPDQCDQPGWTWDARYDPPYGGCVPPASWPASPDCGPASGSPPTCLLCSQDPWAHDQNCPKWQGHTTYLYPYAERLYCCLESPDDAPAGRRGRQPAPAGLPKP